MFSFVTEAPLPITSNGKPPIMLGGVLGEDEEAQDASIAPLLFDDSDHHCRTLQALNMMRKNRHFCDIILHVSFLFFNVFCIQRLFSDLF